MTESITRCINLDWFEVTALEPIDQPHDADYFRSCGWFVDVRDYGTRVWSEMFTLEGTDYLPFVEVRRSPKSDIIAPNVCHLRFVNRVCYFPNAAQMMSEFINRYGYTFQRIARADICLDFERFDYGDLPKDFVRRYMEGKYSKINQSHISAHGSDDWAGRVWNSLSWGSPTSDIGTKFYCKTLELYDAQTGRWGKPYIRQAWKAAGLVDDATNVTKLRPNGEVYQPEIWRLEFSIRSNVKNWFKIELDGKKSRPQSIRNTIDMYDSREKLLVLFASLTQHYFHFKHLIKRFRFYEEGHSDGYAVSKYKCPDKLLFRWKAQTFIYKVAKEDIATSEPVDRTFARLLQLLRQFRETTHDATLRSSASSIIDYLDNRVRLYDQTNPGNRHDALVMQLALREHTAMPWIDPAVLIRTAKELMKMRNEINPFY